MISGGFHTQAKRALIGAPAAQMSLTRVILANGLTSSSKMTWSDLKLYEYYMSAIKEKGYLISAATHPSKDGKGNTYLN